MSAKANAIKASLALFAPTFNRLPSVQSTTTHLKQGIQGRFDMFTLDLAARTLYLGRLVSEQTAELQDETTLQTIAHFDANYDSFSFNYQNGIFHLAKRFQVDGISPAKKFNIQVSSIDLENFDHPFKRQTLYFHELKDLQKYGQLKIRQGVPKVIRKLERKRVQNEYLDKKNPLGIPNWAKPAKIKIEAIEKEKTCGFDLQYRLGEIKLRKCYNKKADFVFDLDPNVMDIKTQEMIFMFLKKKAGMSLQEVEQLSKLAFLGGRVKKVELMMNLIDEITKGLTQ